jgi:TFIIF-interacting CTD phosphatase-like protein
MKLLVLDIDETLVKARFSSGDFRVGPYEIKKRPFLDEFTNQVLQWYELAVWSSASSNYVEEIAKNIFKCPLKFVWSSNKCIPKRNFDTDEFYYVKDLKKVKTFGYDLANVLMIDDSPEKLERNYGNLVRILPFHGDPADTSLKNILPFLESLKDVPDVRKVEKRRILT